MGKEDGAAGEGVFPHSFIHASAPEVFTTCVLGAKDGGARTSLVSGSRPPAFSPRAVCVTPSRQSDLFATFRVIRLLLVLKPSGSPTSLGASRKQLELAAAACRLSDESRLSAWSSRSQPPGDQPRADGCASRVINNESLDGSCTSHRSPN